MNRQEDKIIVRDAQPKDSIQVKVLLEQLGYPQSIKSIEGKINRLTGRKRDRILVAIKDKKIIGLLSLHIMPLLHRKDDICRITAVVVTEEHRRHYVGQRLMEMAEVYAQAHGCCRIEVTSGKHRLGAHEFYKKVGYKIISERFIKEI
jgi:ribosomal protein S18 acetylase RimI-like enzyme